MPDAHPPHANAAARQADAITGVPTAICAFVGTARQGPVNEAVPVGHLPEFERLFGAIDPDRPLGAAVHDFFRNGGRDALVVRLPEEEPDHIGSPQNGTGLHALDRVEAFTLLCLAGEASGNDVPVAAYRHAMHYCAGRGALLLVDPPSAWHTAADAHAGLATLGLSGADARHAALYFPRVLQSDAARGGRTQTFAASGAIAGVVARTDALGGVWKAPAGSEASLRGASGLAVAMSDAGNSILNRAGINVLRVFAGREPVVWGARTLRGADTFSDEFKYIPVRRTASFIEASVRRWMARVGPEPNDERTWARIRNVVGMFLHELFRQGAFAGATAREAFMVRCDAETTTQADLDAGRVNVLVGFAPARPAEFVILRIGHAISGRVQR